jgi:transcription elongation factor Elf1
LNKHERKIKFKLIAAYEWNCPNCNGLNVEVEGCGYEETSMCEMCGLVFEQSPFTPTATNRKPAANTAARNSHAGRQEG